MDTTQGAAPDRTVRSDLRQARGDQRRQGPRNAPAARQGAASVLSEPDALRQVRARLDPSRCPDDKAILWLQIPDAPRTVKGDAGGEIATDGTWSEATREAFADRIESILRQHIRDFDAIRLARRASCSSISAQAAPIAPRKRTSLL